MATEKGHYQKVRRLISAATDALTFLESLGHRTGDIHDNLEQVLLAFPKYPYEIIPEQGPADRTGDMPEGRR